MFATSWSSSVVPDSPSRSPRPSTLRRAWPDAASSSIADGESLPPSYTPTTMQPVRCVPSLPALALNSTSPLRDAAREHAKNFAIQCLAQHLVFVARVEVGIAVDLDEVHVAVDLLEVHSVEAAAHQVGGAHCHVDDLLGRLAHRHRLGLAFDHLLTFFIHLDDLPVARRHEVFRDEKRPPIVDAHAPVEAGRQPLLRHDQLRDLEEALRLFPQAVFGFDLHHVEAEA